MSDICISKQVYQHNIQYYSSYSSVSFLEELVTCHILLFESLHDPFLLKKDIILYENIKNETITWEIDSLSRKIPYMNNMKIKAIRFSNDQEISSFLSLL